MDVIAVPLSSGRFCPHFGGAQQILLCRADRDAGTIHSTETFDAPPHKPGGLPRWLNQQGATVVIAGQMGDRARNMLSRLGIDIVAGGSGLDPKGLVKAYLAGTLESGEVSCHGPGHGHQCDGTGHGRGQQF